VWVAGQGEGITTTTVHKWKEIIEVGVWEIEPSLRIQHLLEDGTTRHLWRKTDVDAGRCQQAEISDSLFVLGRVTTHSIYDCDQLNFENFNIHSIA
jgi:hypothetical protein